MNQLKKRLIPSFVLLPTVVSKQVCCLLPSWRGTDPLSSLSAREEGSQGACTGVPCHIGRPARCPKLNGFVLKCPKSGEWWYI